MILLTEDRKWKNFSHLSWINGSCVLIIALVNSAFFSISVIFMADFCSLGAKMDEDQSILRYEQLFAPEIIGFTEHCLYKEGDMVDYWNIDHEVGIFQGILEASNQYIEATKNT